MNLKTGLLITILALGMTPFAAIGADKVNPDDPNLPMYRDGQGVEHVGIVDKLDNDSKPSSAKNPNDCDCNKSDVGIRASTQPGQTAGSTGEGSGGAKGIDQ